MSKYKIDIDEFKPIIKELKEKHDFKGLWHFTDFTNLRSIFDAGELSSRKACKDNKISFLDGANHEVVNRADSFVHSCTRFYYRPKTPTLYDNEGIKPIEFSKEIHIPIPVYLVFSEKLIYHKDTMFSNGNATNSQIGDSSEFFSKMDWDSIFHDTWFYPEHRDYIINKRHAELLSKVPVDLKYLNEIVFRSNAELKRAINVFGSDNGFTVDEKCFSDKNNLTVTDWRYNNYIVDYKIEYNTRKLELEIHLLKTVENYIVAWGIVDCNGNIKNKLIKDTLEKKFKDEFNNKVDELKDAVKIKLTFNYKPSNGDVIKIFLNGVLSIEETIVLH